MKYFTPAGRLMRFDALDRSGDAFPAYTVGWRIIDEPDTWSRRFLCYKSGQPGYLRAGAKLMSAGVEELLDVVGLKSNDASLCTALGHDDTGPNANSILHMTGAYIAKAVGIEWGPELFQKERHKSLRSVGDGASRDVEVFGKYRCNALASGKTLIVLDDFITRGATLGDMNRALKESNPSTNMLALALAKNENAAWGRSNHLLVNNDHISSEWEALWNREYAKALSQ